MNRRQWLKSMLGLPCLPLGTLRQSRQLEKRDVLEEVVVGSLCELSAKAAKVRAVLSPEMFLDPELRAAFIRLTEGRPLSSAPQWMIQRIKRARQGTPSPDNVLEYASSLVKESQA